MTLKQFIAYCVKELKKHGIKTAFKNVFVLEYDKTAILGVYHAKIILRNTGNCYHVSSNYYADKAYIERV